MMVTLALSEAYTALSVTQEVLDYINSLPTNGGSPGQIQDCS
jgi:hypothetical protein